VTGAGAPRGRLRPNSPPQWDSPWLKWLEQVQDLSGVRHYGQDSTFNRLRQWWQEGRSPAAAADWLARKPTVEKPNCYACQFRHSIPGDAHSECRAPGSSVLRSMDFMVKALAAPPEGDLVVAFDKGPGGPAMTIGFDVYGVQQGYAIWPLNFDPLWLKQCTAFSPKVATDDA
jgi:hypothetical protein